MSTPPRPEYTPVVVHDAQLILPGSHRRAGYATDGRRSREPGAGSREPGAGSRESGARSAPAGSHPPCARCEAPLWDRLRNPRWTTRPTLGRLVQVPRPTLSYVVATGAHATACRLVMIDPMTFQEPPR
ncbi:hypothetical protein FF041_22625 [Streptomyces jumonjinensis]|uniref:Uncharacterized protein n=1 Tax=Streptomyces jumonjinensis TaxID=1945 RepID=A0A646KLE6_STRJU|nr:hypothetical protein [Streptomyces jumonjinensis]